MDTRAVSAARERVARLETGADWRSETDPLAAEVEAGAVWFTSLGAVQDAELRFYDRDDREYRSIEYDEMTGLDGQL